MRPSGQPVSHLQPVSQVACIEPFWGCQESCFDSCVALTFRFAPSSPSSLSTLQPFFYTCSTRASTAPRCRDISFDSAYGRTMCIHSGASLYPGLCIQEACMVCVPCKSVARGVWAQVTATTPTQTSLVSFTGLLATLKFAHHACTMTGFGSTIPHGFGVGHHLAANPQPRTVSACSICDHYSLVIINSLKHALFMHYMN